MLIRSQEKKELHNLDGIKMIKVVSISNGHLVEVNSQHTIGTYSTKEKAIKVLDMIQDDYLYCERCKARGEEAGSIPPFIFQMPQDSEV